MKSFKNTAIIISLLTWFTTLANAQLVDESNYSIEYKLAIKSNLLSSFDFYPNFNVGLEYKIHPRYIIQVTYARIFEIYNESFFIKENRNINGNQLRFEVKRFESTYNMLKNRFYIGPELVLEKVNFSTLRTFKIEESITPGDVYYRYDELSERRSGGRFHLKMGWIYALNENIYIDYYAGVGVRYYYVKHQLPEHTTAVYKNKEAMDLGGTTMLPNLLIGIALTIPVIK